MRLVKFDNGKYGVLRGRLFWTEALGFDGDLYLWWGTKRFWPKYCMGTEQEARKAMQDANPKWKVVK